MSSKKAGGSTRTVNPNPKYRGVKKFGSEIVQAGNIIVRQCGNKFHPGQNTGCGRDFTIYAKSAGMVEFHKQTNRRSKRHRIYINIVPNPSEDNK